MPKKDRIKEQSWIKKFEHFKASGLTIRKWCEQNGEKFYAFKYWKSRLKDTNTQSLKFEEIKADPEKKEIKIVKKEWCIQLSSDIDEQMLNLLLQALEGC